MRDFDFDFTRYGGGIARMSKQPANELWRTMNSADSDRPGSDNIMGVKSPVVDDLLLKMINATTEREYHAAGRALDRVLMHGHYVHPWRSLDVHYAIHHKRLQHPARYPATTRRMSGRSPSGGTALRRQSVSAGLRC